MFISETRCRRRRWPCPLSISWSWADGGGNPSCCGTGRKDAHGLGQRLYRSTDRTRPPQLAEGLGCRRTERSGALASASGTQQLHQQRGSSPARNCRGYRRPSRWLVGPRRIRAPRRSRLRSRDDHAANTARDCRTLATLFGEAQQRYARWGVTSIHLMNNDKSLEVTLAGLAIAKPLQRWTVYSGAPMKPSKFRRLGRPSTGSRSKRCQKSVSKARNG